MFVKKIKLLDCKGRINLVIIYIKIILFGIYIDTVNIAVLLRGKSWLLCLLEKLKELIVGGKYDAGIFIE